MPHWHQKNTLCYNSRYSEDIFLFIIADYCRGIPASKSSKEFKEKVGINISRQTISNYFEGISELAINERRTYPWWSLRWYELNEEHFTLIREIVYNKNSITKTLRKKFRELTGRDRSVDSYIYIEVLRNMSKEINGLPKNKFEHHLIRACEIALPYQILLDDGGSRYDFRKNDLIEFNYNHIRELVKECGINVFRRKRSLTTRRERDQEARIRREREPNEDDHLFGPWKKFKIDTSEESKTKRLLAAVDGQVDADFGRFVEDD